MERKNTIKKNKEGYGYTYTDITAINKYCEENGFYELYDDRLKHNYELLSIKYLDTDIKYNSNIIYNIFIKNSFH